MLSVDMKKNSLDNPDFLSKQSPVCLELRTLSEFSIHLDVLLELIYNFSFSIKVWSFQGQSDDDTEPELCRVTLLLENGSRID